MSERVLCVAAHPDDEALGCGATLAKHVKAGDQVTVLVLADGVASRVHGFNPEQIKERHAMCRKACAKLGVESVWLRAFPDNQMDSRATLEIVQAVQLQFDRVKPTVVYTHWHGDMNVDHRITSQAVQVCCRPLPDSPVKRLLMFEVPSSTEWGEEFFRPNWFEGVAGTMHAKIEALMCYGTEIRDYPHPRSVEAVMSLAQTRGASVGLPMAEAFVVARAMA